ncbi:pyridoxamine 5'-phosphate oxidase [Marinivivus vitaminiproducens]|uniref:pyridoxamine 5'-phosphate oxidase n=1 Tax=Marinivivus vitaminiproducens TaxID=3035935 RepID=UPI0027A056BD|nr:pyridoxamine 5'-phosphate oxidase [Geminicoccaceae bacterium SCSIO 64248]
MTEDLGKLRTDYQMAGLDEAEVDRDPFRQFDLWFDQAREAGLIEPNAMALASADPVGRPSVRMVLLKGADERGFVFYSNFESRKGRELALNPHAALLFWWDRLQRQIRIEGEVAVVAEDEADAYFASRPYGSQIGAWASAQSSVVPDRRVLEDRARHLERTHAEGRVPRPSFWGGYRLVPTRFEFWQGRTSRLHDRLVYRSRDGNDWTIERLSP